MRALACAGVRWRADNIILDAEGHAHLVDFGLSLIMLAQDNFVKGTAGTPGYQAPEVLADSVFTRVSDAFSLGTSSHLRPFVLKLATLTCLSASLALCTEPASQAASQP